MKFHFILILVFAYLFALPQNSIYRRRFIPDSTINQTIKLLNSESILKSLGNQKNNLIQDELPSRVQFASSIKNEYLILYHLDGGNSNSFNMVEVGKLKNSNTLYKALKYKSFETESGIKLGMSIQKLFQIKGGNYIRIIKDGFIIIEYKINDKHDSFLKRYNMPFYNAIYFFKGNLLEKFKFGFPNL